MENRNLVQFIDKIAVAFRDGNLVRLVLSGRRDPGSDLKSMIITPVEIRREIKLKFIYRYTRQDITKNNPLEAALTLIRESIEGSFLNADLLLESESIRLFTSFGGKLKLRSTRQPNRPAGDLQHDRQRKRIVEASDKVYLRELGVLNEFFEVRQEMTAKYIQINRYIELLDPVLREMKQPGELRIADMGSGKGYLTFALYDHITTRLGRTCLITGVEERKELVDECNAVSERAQFSGLSFRQGSIEKTDTGPLDILIALHACDTATDDAILKGIRAGASLIVVAPCCHKQLRKHFKPQGDLKAILKHGILLERQAELLTDGIRALALEAWGYKTRVFEFISTEHTPKNIMIVAQRVRQRSAPDTRILETIGRLSELFHIVGYGGAI